MSLGIGATGRAETIVASETLLGGGRRADLAGAMPMDATAGAAGADTSPEGRVETVRGALVPGLAADAFGADGLDADVLDADVLDAEVLGADVLGADVLDADIAGDAT